MADDTQPETPPWAEPAEESELEKSRRYSRWLESNIERLLKQIGGPGNCSACDAPIYWLTLKSGKKAPYTPKGVSHFSDCPSKAAFRRA
jgi:hypothetical protein